MPVLTVTEGVVDMVVGLTPTQAIGIPLALLGAVFMSLGAMLQHRGVTKVEAASNQEAEQGLSLTQLKRLLTRPSWLWGTLMLGLAIVLQLGSMAFAPLIIVQPIGVVSLILTTIITARQIRVPLSAKKWLAVAMCVLGVGAFVTVAGFYAVQHAIRTWQVITVLVVLVVVIAIYAVLFALFRNRSKGLFYIVGAGVIYGFVATLAKITINRLQNGHLDWLTIVCAVGIIVGTAAGAYFVQTAYASGPPEMVVAGLTVIDPLVGVTIGVTVLLEVDGAPWYTYVLFVLFGAVAVAGVLLLEREQTQDQVAESKKRVLGEATGGVADATR